MKRKASSTSVRGKMVTGRGLTSPLFRPSVTSAFSAASCTHGPRSAWVDLCSQKQLNSVGQTSGPKQHSYTEAVQCIARRQTHALKQQISR